MNLPKLDLCCPHKSTLPQRRLGKHQPGVQAVRVCSCRCWSQVHPYHQVKGMGSAVLNHKASSANNRRWGVMFLSGLSVCLFVMQCLLALWSSFSETCGKYSSYMSGKSFKGFRGQRSRSLGLHWWELDEWCTCSWSGNFGETWRWLWDVNAEGLCVAASSVDTDMMLAFVVCLSLIVVWTTVLYCLGIQLVDERLVWLWTGGVAVCHGQFLQGKVSLSIAL